MSVEPEHRGSTFVLNISIQILHYTLPDPRRQQCLALCPREPATGSFPETHNIVHVYYFTVNSNVVINLLTNHVVWICN